MTLTLKYVDGSTVTFNTVAMFRFAGYRTVVVQLFGNDEVVHVGVVEVIPEPFVFG
jgi:hypothetical protein